MYDGQFSPQIGLQFGKALSSFNVELFSNTQKLSLSILIPNSQCVGVAKEVNNKRAPGLIYFSYKIEN